jgi:hypothetical protein
MSTIHQRLADEHGLAASVASFRRYVAADIPSKINLSANHGSIDPWAVLQPRRVSGGRYRFNVRSLTCITSR